MAAAPSASAIRALALEYKSLSEDPVEGFRVKLLNEEDMFVWEVALFGPPDTLYQGGYFKVNINPARSFLPAVSCVLWVNSACSHARCNARIEAHCTARCAQPECDLRHGPQQQQQTCCCCVIVVWWRLDAETQTPESLSPVPCTVITRPGKTQSNDLCSPLRLARTFLYVDHCYISSQLTNANFHIITLCDPT